MRIPLIESISYTTEIEEVSRMLDELPQSPIIHQPWAAYKSNCETNFAIAHTGDVICLKFFVKEDVIKVTTYQTNGRVHKDNCVEFFVAFGTQKKYYNIEFNCTGICLIGFGERRLNRVLLDEKLIAKLPANASLADYNAAAPGSEMSNALAQAKVTAGPEIINATLIIPIILTVAFIGLYIYMRGKSKQSLTAA